MEESQGWEGPRSPAELGSSGEDREHLNVWLDFLPEHGSYSGAWWGRWQQQFRPGQEHLSFCFHLCVRGRVGSAGGGGWRLLSAGREGSLWLALAAACPHSPSPPGLSELPAVFSL